VKFTGASTAPSDRVTKVTGSVEIEQFVRTTVGHDHLLTQQHPSDYTKQRVLFILEFHAAERIQDADCAAVAIVTGSAAPYDQSKGECLEQMHEQQHPTIIGGLNHLGSQDYVSLSELVTFAMMAVGTQRTPIH
jgi:hypothetical protein